MKNELKLKDFLPYRLSVLSNRISSDIARRYQERFSLTIPEWRVMASLGETPGLSARQVADKTAMDKVAVSRAVAGLLAVKSITRKTDTADKRKVILTLSKKGQAVYRQVVPVALAYEAAILDQLEPGEKRTLSKLLDKISEIQAGIEP
ncbi:MAG: winged helix-turn-helix transcriptional regulator [Proteobacteria bacterium]|nr:winged helix-turn-helix transcriptional regulator [Pseudomonadota bacterium]MCH8323329.1 winged helix-turn-helix transcriptional regulator [Pseudomonadota bacterium]